MKVKTCTFKNDTPPDGLMRVGWQMGADIKYEKKICGHIYPPSRYTEEYNYKVSLMVHTEDMRDWKWITFKARFPSLKEAKQWCKDNWQVILQKHDLHYLED